MNLAPFSFRFSNYIDLTVRFKVNSTLNPAIIRRVRASTGLDLTLFQRHDYCTEHFGPWLSGCSFLNYKSAAPETAIVVYVTDANRSQRFNGDNGVRNTYLRSLMMFYWCMKRDLVTAAIQKGFWPFKGLKAFTGGLQSLRFFVIV